MTLRLDDATVLGALYAVAKRYGIKQLAADLDVPETTLYKRLRGEKGYPLGVDDFDDMLGLFRARNIEGWDRPLQVLNYRHDHLSVRVPSSMVAGQQVEGLQQISQMMREVADIAQAIASATDVSGEMGAEISAREFKEIDRQCEDALEKIAEVREFYRARQKSDKRGGAHD